MFKNLLLKAAGLPVYVKLLVGAILLGLVIYSYGRYTANQDNKEVIEAAETKAALDTAVSAATADGKKEVRDEETQQEIAEDRKALKDAEETNTNALDALF